MTCREKATLRRQNGESPRVCELQRKLERFKQLLCVYLLGIEYQIGLIPLRPVEVKI